MADVQRVERSPAIAWQHFKLALRDSFHPCLILGDAPSYTVEGERFRAAMAAMETAMECASQVDVQPGYSPPLDGESDSAYESRMIAEKEAARQNEPPKMARLEPKP